MTTTDPRGVDIAATPARVSIVSLVLGILSVPGSILTWDVLPGQGFAWGLPPALLAVGLGSYALRADAPPRWAAITGIVLGGAMALMVIGWTLAGAFS